MDNRPKQKKRPVTFSGCWTCKERKVKCDENPDGCAPCSKIGVPCGGYDIKLQWVSSKAGKEPQKYRIPSAGRRRLKRDFVSPFCSRQIDDFLNEIDIDACSQRSSVRGPFTVFPFTFNVEIQSPIESISLESRDDGNSVGVDDRSNPTDTGGTLQSSQYHPNHDSTSSEGISRPEVPSLTPTMRCLSPVNISTLSSISPESSHQGLQLIRQPQLYLSEDPKTSSLFHHYSLHVADILQPLSHPSNPYLSIYVPAAIQGLSEVAKTIRVAAPSVKLCTFHALIATAAFHLHSCNSFAAQYHNIGVTHRQIALQCMQLALSDDITKSSYKDLMMAMLSLITIGVMEGRIIDFQIHIKAMLQLRSVQGQSDRQVITSQTRQLEEMSAFMSLLAYTTSPHTVPSTPILPDTSLTSERSTAYQEEKNYCFESTYGVTSEIAQAIQQTLQIQQWLSLNNTDLTHNLTDSPSNSELYRKIEDLGNQLMDWTFNEKEAQIVFPDATFMQAIFAHHAKAWHNATVIYYTYTTKRILSPNFAMQDSVSRVAEHLHAVEDLKMGYAEQGVRMAPITWPAFVASCCAEPSRRNVWEQWWERVQCYGIGSLQRQYEVVRKVWTETDQGRDGWLEILLRENIEVLAL